MKKSLFTRKLVLLLAIAFALSITSNCFAADRYRVSAQFFHLGELIGKPMMEVEMGETTAGEYSAEGYGHYKIVVLLRPVVEDQVYVSMQFSSGKIDIQPNLIADIGKPRSATIKKIRMNLLVEEIVEEKIKVTDPTLQALTQNDRKFYPD